MNDTQFNVPKIVVVPTINLAKLVYRAVRSGKLPYNYCAGWVDVHGFGLSLAKVDWLAPGQTHINPHTRR